MMRDISLHILDIVTNSLEAGADFVEIVVEEDVQNDMLNVSVSDNGRGMDRELVERVISPFVTSRKTRKVGLGIPLLKAACERSGGRLDISSQPGEGTCIKAGFRYGNIDRPPLGRAADTVIGLIVSNPLIDFVYRHIYNGNAFNLDTREIKKILREVPIDSPEVIGWLASYIREGIERITD